ncbi:MAG: hypothetical protein JWR52_3350 [Marmoricola sp.]|nr:hypothetical protein [Marmoricola sp.]
MELIEIELSEFTRRSRSFVVTHRGAALTRGLEYGERVLVRDHDGYRTAVVADIDFDVDDTSYRLVLGGPVSDEMAEVHLIGDVEPSVPRAAPSVPAPRVSIDDIADLLARSGAAHRIPLQRQVARRLLER